MRLRDVSLWHAADIQCAQLLSSCGGKADIGRFLPGRCLRVTQSGYWRITSSAVCQRCMSHSATG